MEEQKTTTAPVLLEIPVELKQLIEGLIFAADEPLSVRQIKAIYEQDTQEGEARRIEQEEIQQILQELNDEYQRLGKAYRIVAIAGGYQFATMKEYAEWIGRLYKEQSRRKLSQSSLESLAIIAYKQPISKPEIESIRGVNCDYVLRTLLERELVTITGRAETVGRPLLYGTTREFLKHFGLNDVTDLPRPREIEEILGESQFETERRMLEAQAGADQTKKEEEDFKSRLPHIPKKKSEMDETVHILPKKRTRKINLREPEEQQKMPFDAHQGGEDTAGPAEPPTPAVSPDVPAAVLRLTEEPGKTPEEPTDQVPKGSDVEMLRPMEAMEEQPSEKAPEMPEEVERQERTEGTVEEIHVEEIERKPADPVVSLANIEQRTDVEKDVVSVVPPQNLEPEMSQPRRTRWTVWKEKVQTFIRKLFG